MTARTPTRPGDPGAPITVLAVDTGGTFTDLLLLRNQRLETLKVPSTPHDPSEGVLNGLRQLVGHGEAFTLIHGSTVATNTLLERKGARVVLVTNRGFEDVIEIGRQNRPQLYGLVGHRLPPLVERDDRLGIAGRLGPQGEELEPLDPAELVGLAERMAGAESVAVVLLHSYANPAHERAVADAVGNAPPAGPDNAPPAVRPEPSKDAPPLAAGRSSGGHTAAAHRPPLSISSDILPEYREYERTSTTVVNAYVAPVMSRYLGRLDREAGTQRLRIMGSNGGALPVERAARRPVLTVLSGPAGGVVGARTWALRSGYPNVITFDMGGTSTDVSICPERLLHTREFEIAGQPVALPVIDIHTVGAGGGSLARVDAGGALRVGPQSAGADPGPICYGLGGTEPTVTDAHVWLGRLPVDAFLGGRGSIDRNAIRPHLEDLARAMGSTPDEAAEGVVAVANTAMERALRVISVERGYDPSDFVLVAFGGAGGLHVAELAHRLGAARAMVPPDPGLLSAYGMLVAPITQDLSRTVLLSARRPDIESTTEQVFTELEAEALSRMEEDGFAAAHVTLERRVDARYHGQSFELQVPATDWVAGFHRVHRERYGYDRLDTAVEAVTLRVVARAPGSPVEHHRVRPADGPPPMDESTVFVGGRRIACSRVWRVALRPGHVLAGPLLVLEYSSTTWVPDGYTLEVDEWGCLHLVGGH